MNGVVLTVGTAVLAASFSVWLALGAALLLGRSRYDRAARAAERSEVGAREASRLVRRVERPARSEWGRWRRVSALRRLDNARHPAVPRLVALTLADRDQRIVTAAIRTLGDIGDDWAVDMLIDALRRGDAPRSRVAAELDALAPRPGPKLVPLLRDWDPAMRFWAATLVAPYSDLAESSLVGLAWDGDPNVRAAAVEALGMRSGEAAATALLAALEDSAWFVRVHAARAAAHVVGAEAAPSIARLLADEKWWVRTAAKDGLRTLGSDAVPALLSTLAHEDAFARNGAAEVLQDIGFVDFLAVDDPRSALLERIYEAGGERLREAAEVRRVELSAGEADAAEAQAAA